MIKMKRLVVLIAVTMTSHLVFAQKQESDSSKMEYKKHAYHDMHGRKEMMKALNLSEDQKAELKKIKMADKEKRSAILNNSKLSEEQKHEQLKELHNVQAKSMQRLLTDEQKTKLKEAREKMKAGHKATPDKINGKKIEDDKSPVTESVKQ